MHYMVVDEWINFMLCVIILSMEVNHKSVLTLSTFRHASIIHQIISLLHLVFPLRSKCKFLQLYFEQHTLIVGSFVVCDGFVSVGSVKQHIQNPEAHA